MRLLLDTHVALWTIVETKKIPPRIQRLIVKPDNEVFVSAVSVWELGLKFGAGRSRRQLPPRDVLVEQFEITGFKFLDVSMRHAVAFEDHAQAHPDPYDRMILTQALIDGLRLVTVDSRLAEYSESIISW